MSNIYVRFIDILFAVVIGQSFVLLSSEERYASWFTQPFDNAFKIATLLLVYGLVITSWVGYHQSTSVYPIRNPLRFVIDIVLLFLYYTGFVNANNFELVSWIFFFTFLLYTAWDFLRLWEYWDVSLVMEKVSKEKIRKQLIKRLSISGSFTIFFLASIIIYLLCLKNKILGIEWAFFVIILLLLILYRYLKWYKKPSEV